MCTFDQGMICTSNGKGQENKEIHVNIHLRSNSRVDERKDLHEDVSVGAA